MTSKVHSYCLISLIIACVIFGGFAVAEDYVSVSEVIEKAGYAEEEVELIDIEQFIMDEQITAELLAEVSSEDLRKVLQEIIDNASGDSYEFLFNDATRPFSEFDVDSADLELIAVMSTNDALIPSLLIDLTEGKAYFSNGNLFADVGLAEKITKLETNHLALIMEAVHSANICEWEASYEGDLNETNCYFESVAIKTSEGIYRYEKKGSYSDAPDTTTNFMLTLYKMFW